jgi:ribosomal-protein-alanine N-acetyltransferase
VGFAGALLAAGDLHVVTIATDPVHTRSGIATRLLHELIERGIAMGAHALTLEVRASNHAAQALYRRFGLAPVGIRKGYYDPDGEDAIIMWADDITTPEYRTRLDAIAETFPPDATDPRPIEASMP